MANKTEFIKLDEKEYTNYLNDDYSNYISTMHTGTSGFKVVASDDYIGNDSITWGTNNATNVPIPKVAESDNKEWYVFPEPEPPIYSVGEDKGYISKPKFKDNPYNNKDYKKTLYTAIVELDNGVENIFIVSKKDGKAWDGSISMNRIKYKKFKRWL